MIDKKIKVLFIHHGGGQGGAFISIITTIKNLNKEKYIAKILLLQKWDGRAINVCQNNKIDFELANNYLYKNFRYYFIHSEVGPIKWYKIPHFIKIFIYWFLSAYYFAPRILRKEAPDIVHLNSSVLSDWTVAAKKVGIKNVIHIREPIANGYIGFRKYLFRTILKRNTDHIIAISKDNAKRVNIPSKTTIIYDVVETGKNLSTEHSYANKTILYAGGTDTHKGFITFAKALDFIDKDITVYFAGIVTLHKKKFWQPSRKLNNCKIKLFEKIKNNKNVHFTGFTNDIEILLSKCTLSLSAFSVPHCSMLVMESFSMKKPAIGSNVEGMDELIEDGKDGILFKANDPVALAQSINYICSNPDKAKEMGKAGYMKYKKLFSNDDSNKFELIYEKLVSDKF